MLELYGTLVDHPYFKDMLVGRVALHGLGRMYEIFLHNFPPCVLDLRRKSYRSARSPARSSASGPPAPLTRPPAARAKSDERARQNHDAVGDHG